MTMIKTTSWFSPLPPAHVKIGISRGVPRNERPGYRRLRALEPGPWFDSVPPDEYLRRYDKILERLVPRIVVADLRELAGEGRVPVLCCWEAAAKIEAGEQWCHRHLVAAWLEQHLGITIEEVGYEGRPFDRFACLRAAGVEPPGHGGA
jgi:hypothetical protein